ncbi:MAG: DUF2029 domain-containing protein [Clostridia bacterium]|nr:DUF2029 domain-containing protein [Clostridia bacterium]
MNIYEYRPEKNLTRIFGVMIILISLAAALFFTPLIFPSVPFHWAFQLLGTVAVVAVIYLLTRYVAKSFVYAVIEDDGQLDFTVTELANGGKKVTTVCRVAIANITELHVFDMNDPEQKLREKEIWAEAHRESRKCYDYCHDIKTTPVCLIALEECGEPLLIKIAAEDRLCSLLGGEK